MSKIEANKPKARICIYLSICLFVFVLSLLNIECYERISINIYSDNGNVYIYVPYVNSKTILDSKSLYINKDKYYYQIISGEDDLKIINNVSYQLFLVKIDDYYKINNLLVDAKVISNKFKLYQKLFNII